ncbi:MAG: tRNA (adenosine(37)-N6)-dimethylallyltransferase MiaA [Treponemataceae bacterium]|nr:tRNA (adenosine(37)-N6)-dimethylallyltransferase MiaA [Treponemataceae bacterium]
MIDFKKTGVQSEITEGIPVLVITAPTATGKTELLADMFASDADSPLAGRAEIISSDSMQVYKGLDIGTAKPDKAFCSRLPHHLIDICSPDYQYGSGEFLSSADSLCLDIWKRGKLPVICGGTTFYVRNFLYGLPAVPESNAAIRQELERRIKNEGSEVLWKELSGLDPESAAKIHVNDEYRIKRALEVYLSTGKKRSDFSVPVRLRQEYKFCIIKLERSREDLYERINKRVDEMFSSGLPDEFFRLISAGYKKSDPAMQAIGYREFFMVSEEGKEKSVYLEEVKDLIKKDTRHYAKKQVSFFRNMPDGESFPMEDLQAVRQKILCFFSSHLEKT